MKRLYPMGRLMSYNLLSILIVFLFYSCNSKEEYISSTLNPNGIAPLSGLVSIYSNKKCEVNIKLIGDDYIEHTYNDIIGDFDFPILGLYPNKKNLVEIKRIYSDRTLVDTMVFQTDTLPSFVPDIKIGKLQREKMQKGLHLCDLHFAQDGRFHSKPILFDDQGVIRWYMDLSFYDAILWPIIQLSDGTILVSGKNKMFEYDLLGNLKKEITLDGKYWIHHEVIEIPNDQLLIAVGKTGSTILLKDSIVGSAMDFILLWDRKEGKVIKEWDLAEVLDVTRYDLNHGIGGEGNWLHMNGLAFDSEDNSIYVSAKHQGLIKISWENKLKWILSPNNHWGKSGRKSDGFETKDYVLTAIDKEGIPYPEEIQNGNESLGDFDFPWGNHSPKLLDNGNVLLFDNGTFRNWKKENSYSRAVEYKIDEENKTVSQIWEYGKEKGGEFFSLIVSDVDKLDNSNVLITSGNIESNDKHFGKIVEVEYPSGEEIFEADIYFKDLKGTGLFGWGQFDVLYRSERFELYK